MRSADLAYLAGVIDSDGTIGVKRSTYSMRVTGDSSQPTYSERVSVRQVEPQAVDLAAALFGGSRYITKPSVPNGRPLATWVVTDLKAAEFLRAVLPHLRIKKRQATNALALRSVKNASKEARVRKGRGVIGSLARTTAHSNAMEKIYLQAKELNRVGQRGG